MPRKPRVAPSPMPPEVWVSRYTALRDDDYLTWDLEPATPKGDPPATRYVRADVAEAAVEGLRVAVDALRDLMEYAKPHLPATPYNMYNATMRHLNAAASAIAKTEGRSGLRTAGTGKGE